MINANLHQIFHSVDSIDWAPRFGFAWSPGGSDKTGVRGGIGIFYDAFPAVLGDSFMTNIPTVTSVTQFSSRGQRLRESCLGLTRQARRQSVAHRSATNAQIRNGFASGASYASLSLPTPLFASPASTACRQLPRPAVPGVELATRTAAGQQELDELGLYRQPRDQRAGHELPQRLLRALGGFRPIPPILTCYRGRDLLGGSIQRQPVDGQLSAPPDLWLYHAGQLYLGARFGRDFQRRHSPVYGATSSEYP
jgi:hypothetical protein